MVKQEKEDERFIEWDGERFRIYNQGEIIRRKMGEAEEYFVRFWVSKI